MPAQAALKCSALIWSDLIWSISKTSSDELKLSKRMTKRFTINLSMVISLLCFRQIVNILVFDDGDNGHDKGPAIHSFIHPSIRPFIHITYFSFLSSLMKGVYLPPIIKVIMKKFSNWLSNLSLGQDLRSKLPPLKSFQSSKHWKKTRNNKVVMF